MRIETRSLQKDEHAPWERLTDEPPLWFQRFREYKAQAPPRSAVAVYRAARERKGTERHGKKRSTPIDFVPASWTEAKRKFRWQERADLWDQAQRERLDRELVEQREAEREKELQIAATLRTKAEALLTLPILKEEVKRDKDGAIIAYLLIPEFRAFLAANALFTNAKNHARAALEMPDKFDRQELTGKNGAAMTIVTHPVGVTEVERLEKLMALAQRIQGEHV